jgi:hypothetical protein
MEDLIELIRRIHVSGAEFVLIGGLAAVRYGSVYGTIDADICTRFAPDNIRKIGKGLEGLNPRFRQRRDLPFELSDERLAGLKNLYIHTNIGDLDCLGEVAGLGSYEKVLEVSVLVEFPFGNCRVLSLDGLIKAKESLARPKDLLVATELRAIREKLNS